MGLIAHYKLDGNANDAFGKYNGTASGALVFEDGKLGKCINLKTSGSVTFPTSIKYTYSVSFWYKRLLPPDGSYRKIFMKGSDRSPGFWTGPTDLLHLRQTLINGGNSGADIYGIGTGVWRHIVFTCEQTAAGVRINSYMDGVKSTSSSFYAGDTVNITGDPNSFVLNSDSSVGHSLDDVRIYDHALSEREVRDLAQGLVLHYTFDQDSGSIVRDSSTQGNDGQVVGAKWVEGGMVGKGCYEFTQDGKHIDTGNKFNFKKTDSFTVGFWINPEDHSSEAAAAGGVIGKGHWFDNTWDVFIYNANFLRFECSGNATRNGTTQVDSPVLPLNQWSHFVVTYDTGSITGYLNGQVVGTTPYLGTGDFNNPNTTLIGMRYGDVSRTLKGQLDDVRIYTTALSTEEVKELYQQRASLDSGGNLLC